MVGDCDTTRIMQSCAMNLQPVAFEMAFEIFKVTSVCQGRNKTDLVCY